MKQQLGKHIKKGFLVRKEWKTRLRNIVLNHTGSVEARIQSCFFVCFVLFLILFYPSWLPAVRSLMEKSFYHKSMLIFLLLPGASSALLMDYDSLLSRKAFSPQSSWEMLFSRPNALQITADLQLDLKFYDFTLLPSVPNMSWLKGSLNKVNLY